MKDDGTKVDPITYKLKQEKGFKIGIITTVPITHATPAAFYAHQKDRNNYDDISKELISSNFDYFGNGGFNLREYQVEQIEYLLKENNYNVVKTKEEIKKLNSKSGKVIAINPNQKEGLTPFEFETGKDELKLSDFVKKGIDVLESENGFFMMVESGMVDFASHNNDAKSVISEVNALDNAVKEALNFYNKHKDETLIIVTGDHETGGLTIGNSTSGYNLNTKILQNQKISYMTLENYMKEARANNYSFGKVFEYLKENFGISLSDKSKIYVSQTEFNRLALAYENGNLNNLLIEFMSQKAGIGWTTKNHTGSPITVYSIGAGSDNFSGVYSTIEFNSKLLEVLKVK